MVLSYELLFLFEVIYSYITQFNLMNVYLKSSWFSIELLVDFIKRSGKIIALMRDFKGDEHPCNFYHN